MTSKSPSEQYPEVGSDSEGSFIKTLSDSVGLISDLPCLYAWQLASVKSLSHFHKRLSVLWGLFICPLQSKMEL